MAKLEGYSKMHVAAVIEDLREAQQFILKAPEMHDILNDALNEALTKVQSALLEAHDKMAFGVDVEGATEYPSKFV